MKGNLYGKFLYFIHSYYYHTKSSQFTYLAGLCNFYVLEFDIWAQKTA